MRPFIDRLSYANVMSTVAVFLALTGSAVAAGVPGMITGEQIQDGKGAKVRITFDDARSGSLELDVTADEARAMGSKGRQVARRGRKPKSS